MLVSIMQPYFFPYMGYFQLVARSSIFVIHDDVQYIKGGWINRNRILQDGRATWITLPVLAAAHDAPINQRAYELTPRNISRLIRRVEACYRHAPNYTALLPVISEIMQFEDSNVSRFNANLIARMCAHMGLKTQIIEASGIVRSNPLSGQDRVIDLCSRLKAERYINPPGGAALYDPEKFHRAGIKLGFLEPVVAPYPQFGRQHVTSLSIIDVLMFNTIERVSEMLNEARIAWARSGEQINPITPPAGVQAAMRGETHD